MLPGKQDGVSEPSAAQNIMLGFIGLRVGGLGFKGLTQINGPPQAPPPRGMQRQQNNQKEAACSSEVILNPEPYTLHLVVRFGLVKLGLVHKPQSPITLET